MTSRRTTTTAAKRPPELRRLPLDPCPAGVREVVLSSTVTLRYRHHDGHVEGALYRLRRKGEQGEPVLRFANRRLTVAELLHALMVDADLQMDERTVLWYLNAIDARPMPAAR